MTEVPTVEIPDPTQDAVEVPASQPDCAEAAAEAPPPEGAMATDVPTVEDKVICRRCIPRLCRGMKPSAPPSFEKTCVGRARVVMLSKDSSLVMALSFPHASLKMMLWWPFTKILERSA